MEKKIRRAISSIQNEFMYSLITEKKRKPHWTKGNREFPQKRILKWNEKGLREYFHSLEARKGGNGTCGHSNPELMAHVWKITMLGNWKEEGYVEWYHLGRYVSTVFALSGILWHMQKTELSLLPSEIFFPTNETPTTKAVDKVKLQKSCQKACVGDTFTISSGARNLRSFLNGFRDLWIKKVSFSSNWIWHQCSLDAKAVQGIFPSTSRLNWRWWPLID